MPEIKVLDENTIDKIAAGEVIERPSSVVKELVENAVDAGASAITVEIKGGGSSLIRVTDNGCGIDSGQISIAFLRHSTSKIRSADDLLRVSSLGFRGEALSSIAAVSQVELITRPKGAFTGTRYVIEGGKEISGSETAAPEGTTFLVRNLFYNTPARRKFLKTEQTEAGYVSSIMEHMALSNPDISFKFINNGQIRLHTPGNGRPKDMIYHIYGRDIAMNLLEVKKDFDDYSISGYIGKPVICRGNRNYESYFVNGRYVKSQILAKSIEDAYRGFLMQHKFPFTVLYITIDGSKIDVNVHPGKMQLRISGQEQLYMDLMTALREVISRGELIPDAGEGDRKKAPPSAPKKAEVPEQFEKQRLEKLREAVSKDSPYERKYTAREPSSTIAESSKLQEMAKEKVSSRQDGKSRSQSRDSSYQAVGDESAASIPVQITYADLPGEEAGLLAGGSAPGHRIIGQLFGTYWLVEYQDKFYMIDQHAAHEKILYERTMKSLKNKEYTSQLISPPIVLTLTMREEELLSRHLEAFRRLGYEISSFGGNEYAISAVPGNLYDLNAKELFISIIDELDEITEKDTPDMVLEKIASMSCKAAVKGNSALSYQEASHLIDELMELDNPYFCPHGRPVIISMSKYEIEKKFKRIV